MNYFLSRDDEELTEACYIGDDGAREVLAARHGAVVYSYLLLTLGDEAAASDIFRMSIARAFKRLRPRGEKNYFRKQAFRFAYHLAAEYLRAHGDSFFSAVSEAKAKKISCQGTIVPIDKRGSSREEIFMSGSPVEWLRFLDMEERKIFLLRQYSGLNFSDIAEITGMHRNTLLALMCRVVAKLSEFRRNLSGNSVPGLIQRLHLRI